MTFVFVENQPFEWPVEIPVPNGGSHDTVTITGLFEIIDDEEFFAIETDVTTMSAGIDLDISRMMRVFKGWKEGAVLDKDKEPLPATPENIRRFLAHRPARLAVLAAYDDAITPKKGYRAKN